MIREYKKFHKIRLKFVPNPKRTNISGIRESRNTNWGAIGSSSRIHDVYVSWRGSKYELIIIILRAEYPKPFFKAYPTPLLQICVQVF